MSVCFTFATWHNSIGELSFPTSLARHHMVYESDISSSRKPLRQIRRCIITALRHFTGATRINYAQIHYAGRRNLPKRRPVLYSRRPRQKGSLLHRAAPYVASDEMYQVYQRRLLRHRLTETCNSGPRAAVGLFDTRSETGSAKGICEWMMNYRSFCGQPWVEIVGVHVHIRLAVSYERATSQLMQEGCTMKIQHHVLLSRVRLSSHLR